MKLRKTLAGILGAVVMLLGVGTFEHVNREKGVHAADGTYEKATSIAVGDAVVLVCEKAKNEFKSMNNSNYGDGVSYTETPNAVVEFTVVEGSVSGTFAFKYGSNYIAWKSNGGNKLYNSTTLNQYSSWKVTFSNGDAVIANGADNNRKLQWNAGSPRFACYTSSQTAVQLYKWVESDLVTLDTPAVTLNEATGVVTWAAITNANGYTYKLNGVEQNTQNTSVNLKSGDTFSVKANGTDGKFNDSKYTEVITYTSYSDKVVDLLDAEYNEGHYIRHTIININASAVMEDLERLNENLNPEEQVNYAELFHAEVTMLERNTYFDGDQLWMENEEGTYSYYGTSENGKDVTSDRVSTLEETSNKVVLKNVGGMEGYFTTLTDIIEHSKNAAWTYSNGVYKSTDDKLIKDFLDFTAPCFYNAFSKGGLENYIKLSSVTVQNLDDQVVLKLLVEDGDSGKLVENSNLVLSQATISKFNIQRNDNLEKPVTITFDDTKKRTEYDTSHQVWEENGIVITNTKGSSTNNVADYAKPVRFYKDSTVSITCNAGKFSTISIESDSSDNKYLTALTSSLNSISDVVVATSGNVVTITFTEPQSTFSFVATGGQVRINSITCA